jgi:hypothetical protein
MITCHQCNKELYETDDPEPYNWICVDGYIYCWSCSELY